MRKIVVRIFIVVALLLVVLFGCDTPHQPIQSYPLNDFVGTYKTLNNVSTLVMNADFTGSISDNFRNDSFSWDYTGHSSTSGITSGIAYFEGGIIIRKRWYSDGILFGDYGEYNEIYITE